MKECKYSILLSSLPKSGTVLMSNILRKITNLKTLGEKLINNDENTSYGGINMVTKDKILVYKDFLDENNSIYKHEKTDITNQINLDESCIYVGHESPQIMLNNDTLKKIEKKVYCYRYGLDVLNSKLKFIENVDYVLALMTNLNDQKEYQALRYFTPGKVLDTIEGWEKHTFGYIENKEQFYGVQYEALLENPKSEIKKLADYLEVEIFEDSIDDIISELFFKELEKSDKSHTYYQHYNKSKKVGEWGEFLPYSFYQKFENRNETILKELNYPTNKIEPYENSDFHNIFLRKLNLYQDQINNNSIEDNFANSFIDSLNSYLHCKKIAIYGNDDYSTLLLSKLDQSIEIVLICDDCEFNNENVKSPKELLFNISKFDFILIAKEEKYHKDIRDNIKKSLRLHGGVEIIDGYNKYFHEIFS